MKKKVAATTKHSRGTGCSSISGMVAYIWPLSTKSFSSHFCTLVMQVSHLGASLLAHPFCCSCAEMPYFSMYNPHPRLQQSGKKRKTCSYNPHNYLHTAMLKSFQKVSFADAWLVHVSSAHCACRLAGVFQLLSIEMLVHIHSSLSLCSQYGVRCRVKFLGVYCH